MSFKFYNQREYEHVPYEYQGNGRNIKTSGCGVCSACMIVENMLGLPLPVEEAAVMAVECGARIEYGSDMVAMADELCRRYPLTYEMTNDAGRVLQFLKDKGGMVVANSGGNREGYTGVFTKGGHYIVLAEANGRMVTVLDPNLYDGKFEEPGREGKVTVEGNLAFTKISVVAEDCSNRTPAYFLFRKK